jgi:hypothetical protein
VNSIAIETRVGATAVDEVLPLGERELEDAVGRLDGDRTTVVTVSIARRLMFVGGGRGHYTVTSLDEEDGESHALVGDAGAEGDTRLMIGGQLISQPRRYLVTREDALSVAKEFVRTGQFARDERWESPEP